MSNRRWYAGLQFEHKGFEFRCVQGNKCDEDLVLQMRVDGSGWRHVPDAIAFILADFKYENEEILYPRSEGYKGGDKHLAECRRAARHGWGQAQAWLEHEQGAIF